MNFYGHVSGGKPPYRFYWDFGDRSSTAGDQNATHTYIRIGNYDVLFRVYDSTNDGAFDGNVKVKASGWGALGGRVGIRSEGSFYLLDGQGIVGGAVTARDVATGDITQTSISGGVYSFTALPPGTYDLAATISYTDHIPYDADLLTFGCPGPSGGTVIKQVTSQAVRVTLSSSRLAQDVVFPPPMVFVHAAFDCYQKWYATDSDPGLTRMWDNDARAFGLISFTPNYQWWNTQATWPLRTGEVHDQLASDLAGISSVSPPVIMVAHDMGGLVARALTSGDHISDPLIQQIRRIYLLGTPNSGSDLLMGGGTSNLMSTDAIIRRFNRIYPDFGSTEVYAIGGSKGEWGLTNTDGYVPLLSAFTISRQVCSADAFGFTACKDFPTRIFSNGDGHIFPYAHLDLGSPVTTTDILENTILPGVFGLASAQAGHAHDGWRGPSQPSRGHYLGKQYPYYP